MNITQVKQALPILIKHGIVPFFWGHHAQGKSETIETWAKDNNYLCFNFRMNLMVDTGDIIGLAEFVKDPMGNLVATKFCMHNWLKTAIDYCQENPSSKAIIFFDELNRAARPDLLGPIFQMSLDHRLHEIKFPSNLHIICAGNPATSDYSVLSMQDKALLSRFCHIAFLPTKAEFFQYAEAKEYNPLLLSFYKEHPDALDSTLETFSISEYVLPDRRKSKWLNALLNEQLTKDIRFELFSGLIGLENTIAFEAFEEKQDKPLSVSDILHNYSNLRDKVRAYSQEPTLRMDILNKAVRDLTEFYTSQPTFTTDEATNTVAFLEDLPNDLMFNLLHAIFNDKQFHDFSEANYHLFKNVEERMKEIRRKLNPEPVKDLLG